MAVIDAVSVALNAAANAALNAVLLQIARCACNLCNMQGVQWGAVNRCNRTWCVDETVMLRSKCFSLAIIVQASDRRSI